MAAYSPPTPASPSTSAVSSPLALQVQYSVKSRLEEEQDEDIPRSARGQFKSPSPGPQNQPAAATLLPLGGEQVLPPGRRVHPIVEPLLQQQQLLRPPASSGLPIVEAPPATSPQTISLQDPHQSSTFPTGQRASPAAAAESTGRRVLLLIPPNVEGGLLLRCYQNVSKTIIHADDQLTLLWTGLITDDEQEPSSGGTPDSSKSPMSSFALAPRKVFSVPHHHFIRPLLTSFAISGLLVGGIAD